jgi:hypothetical protein
MPTTIPTCFFVGAPKAASTSLASFLREQPGTFVPILKELRGLAPDVYDESRGMTRAQYLAHFAEAPSDVACVAEASPLYLYSSEAPGQIAALNANAKIVVVLRDPVQLVRSLHMQNVKDRIEPIFELELALGAEQLRTAGVSVPSNKSHTTHAYLHYAAIATYAPQLKRYLAAFPRRQIHVIIFERLLAAPEEELSRLLDFLELPVHGSLRLPRENPAGVVRNSFASRLVTGPPASVKRLARLLPSTTRGRIADWVWRSSIHANASRSLSLELDAYLRNSFAPDVRAVEQLLELDLPEWKAPASRGDKAPGASGLRAVQ